MIVRELLTRLGFSIDQKPLKQFEASISSLKAGVAALGVTLSAYGAFQFFKGAADAANEILNTSQKIGIGVESLQRLKYAAEFSDISLGQLAGGLKILNKNLVEAQGGSKEAAEAFTDVLGKGFNPKQYKNAEELIFTVADRFKGMEDGAKKTSMAMKIFGKSGADMIPFLNTGSEAIRRQGEELEALGGVLGVEALKGGEEFNNGLHRMNTFFIALRNTIAARFFPAFNGLMDRFIAFLKQNREVIKQRLDHYLNAIARTAQFLGAVVTTLFKGFETLTKALGSVEAATIAATLAMAAFGVITGIVNVVTLAILALAAAIFLLWEDYQTFVEGGESLLKWPKWIRAIKAEFEDVAKLCREIKDLTDTFIGNPIGDMVEKWYLDKAKWNMKINGGEARTRAEIDDDLRGTVGGGFLPAVPLFDMGAPGAGGMSTYAGDKILNNDVNVNQSITVNVQSAADADQIAEEVARTVREQNEKDWVETDRALESGAFN